MQNMQYFDVICPHPVWQYVGRSRDDEFTRSGNPTGASKMGMRCEILRRFTNPGNQSMCGLRVTFRDIVCRLFEASLRPA
jgi:hypothetical protein